MLMNSKDREMDLRRRQQDSIKTFQFLAHAGGFLGLPFSEPKHLKF